MKFLKLLLATTVINLTLASALYAGTPHFIDFSKVLNQSEAGKKAQTFLKKKYENDLKKFSVQEKNLREKEKKLISQKKMITSEEYQNKIRDLRTEVAKYQESKKNLFKKSQNYVLKLKLNY